MTAGYRFKFSVFYCVKQFEETSDKRRFNGMSVSFCKITIMLFFVNNYVCIMFVTTYLQVGTES